MEHTKGKCVFIKHEEHSKWHGNINIEKGIGDNNIMDIRTVACLTGYGNNAKGNAQRIVACWNACDGIEDPTQLRKQYDDLLDALKKYGDHLGCCHQNLRMGECNCGYLDIIK